MKTRKILIAFDSDTIRSLLGVYLREAGYEVLEATDGIEALKLVFKEIPDAVVISTEIPGINGYDFSHVVKNTKQIKNTVVILSTNEEGYESKFWADNSNCDGFYVPASNNIHTLCQNIEKKLENQNSENEEKESTVIHEKDIIKLITDTFSAELFNLYIIKTVFLAGNYMWDTESVLTHMSKTLSSIYNYDALGVIVNEDPIIEFYDHTDTISQNDFDEFRKICQSDFTQRTPNRKNHDWSESIFNETFIEQFTDVKEKLKNYDIFPIDASKRFPMTIHTASCGMGTINSRTRKRIDFLAEVYAPIIEKTITFKKTKFSEEKIRRAFTRFLPEQVVEEIITSDEQKTSSVGEQRKVAILMADIRSFTTISELNKPENVITFLNNYFSVMGKIIKKHGGTIDKFMGDCIMALFGVPDSYKYNGDRAAKAALEMAEAVKKIDTSILTMPEGINFSIGIGVHYGNPIAGTIGSEYKKEYTVIGDDVNLASRVENLTKIYDKTILITGAVKEDIEAALKDDKFGLYLSSATNMYMRNLDLVKVKGKSIPVEIYELTDSGEHYDREFLDNYEKALFQYKIGNFSGAQDYLGKAILISDKDQATRVLFERCKNLLKNKPEEWDGAVTLTVK